MLPSFVGLLVLGIGLVLIYTGVHGGGFLPLLPRPGATDAGGGVSGRF